MAVGLGEMARSVGKFFVPMPSFLADNAGDFAGAYALNWVLNATMDLTRLKRIPENRRLIMSANLSLATVVAIETLPIFGTPDLKDIPAGVVGILASIGVRKLAQRWVGEQVK